jgi:hypothetical protein
MAPDLAAHVTGSVIFRAIRFSWNALRDGAATTAGEPGEPIAVAPASTIWIVASVPAKNPGSGEAAIASPP